MCKRSGIFLRKLVILSCIERKIQHRLCLHKRVVYFAGYEGRQSVLLKKCPQAGTGPAGRGRKFGLVKRKKAHRGMSGGHFEEKVRRASVSSPTANT